MGEKVAQERNCKDTSSDVIVKGAEPDEYIFKSTMTSGFNWFLIIVTVVVAALAVLTVLYLLVHYQHPEDKNQAWFPKAVVILGLTLAIWTVLLFPLDAGEAKCS